MTSLMVDGVPYTKKDGQCAHPSCSNFVDFTRHFKPPTGWAHVILSRRGKGDSDARSEFLICPEHTVNFVARKPSLKLVAKKFIRTIIESPFSGDLATNLRYLRRAMHHAIHIGEAPYASHGLYTQPEVLDDTLPAERALGMEAGFAWSEGAEKVTVYTDLGLSDGMKRGIERHQENGKLIEYRRLPEWDGPKASQGSGDFHQK
jgi:hypothetical protein